MFMLWEPLVEVDSTAGPTQHELGKH